MALTETCSPNNDSLKGKSHQIFFDLHCVKNAQDLIANYPDLDKPYFHPQIQLFLHHPRTSSHRGLVTMSNTSN